VIGFKLAGPLALLAAGAAGAAAPRIWAKRSDRRRSEALEVQLVELVEAAALAVRTGLSIGRAIEFAAAEAADPIAPLVQEVVRRQRLGSSFEDALDHFGETLGTDDGRLFVLVVGIHGRSGGDLAGALDDVTATIRRRIAVRRELRALSAQGRISGAVLGSLPIAFFLVLAGTSHRELAPVYRSAAGIGMVGAGMAMQGLAYVWIRRILRVEL